MRILAALFLAACTQPFAPPSEWLELQPRTAITDSAAVLAQQCAQRDRLPLQRSYASLELYRIQAMSFDLQGNRYDLEAPELFEGWATGRRVYVVEHRAENVLFWAHEFLHAMYGLWGRTHPSIFTRCGLYPI